MMTNSGE